MGSALSRSSWEDYQVSSSGERLLSTPKVEMTSYDNRVSAYLADDPRSPTNTEATFERTPLELRVGKNTTRDSADGSFLMFSKASTPTLPKPPMQTSLDPRSPTIGLARTPVVVDDKQSVSLEVMTNHSNLQITWDLDESNSNDMSSEDQFANKNLMSSTPKPVKEEKPSTENSLNAPRTPLSKLQVSANSPSNLIIGAEKSLKKRKQKTPSRNYQKEALVNRIRRNADLVQHDKEN